MYNIYNDKERVMSELSTYRFRRTAKSKRAEDFYLKRSVDVRIKELKAEKARIVAIAEMGLNRCGANFDDKDYVLSSARQSLRFLREALIEEQSDVEEEDYLDEWEHDGQPDEAQEWYDFDPDC
jgi:hypothetical protein